MRLFNAVVTEAHVRRAVARIRRQPNGCWLLASRFGGTKSATWYSEVKAGGVRILAHRVLFAAAGGVLTPETVVCHRCDTPGCCNPRHLFGGSQSDNIQDAANKGRLYQQTCPPTHCKRGHEFTPENTLYDRRGRQCRTCTLVRGKRRTAAYVARRDADPVRRAAYLAHRKETRRHRA